MLDLTSAYNAALAEDWLSQDPRVAGNNLAKLLPGTQTRVGTEFDIRGVVQLSSKMLQELQPNFPDKLTGISVGKPCRKLHFVHGAAWAAPQGATIAKLVMHRADGSEVRVPIRYGNDVLQWWRGRNEVVEPGLTIAWTGTNEAQKRQPGASLQLFKTTWTNSSPDLVIGSIDYVSEMSDAAPFLLAITIE
jgi:hypothetical protein